MAHTGVAVTQGSFSRQQVSTITGLTARQLSYWRKTGLVTPQGYTSGGHARYSFTDLIALRTAKRLLDADVSLQRIRKCLQSLLQFLPQAEQPLVELSLVVTGDVVLVFRGEHAFDALTGQQWVFPIAALAEEVEQLQQKQIAPEQGELFSIDSNINEEIA